MAQNEENVANQQRLKIKDILHKFGKVSNRNSNQIMSYEPKPKLTLIVFMEFHLVTQQQMCQSAIFGRKGMYFKHWIISY